MWAGIGYITTQSQKHLLRTYMNGTYISLIYINHKPLSHINTYTHARATTHVHTVPDSQLLSFKRSCSLFTSLFLGPFVSQVSGCVFIHKSVVMPTPSLNDLKNSKEKLIYSTRNYRIIIISLQGKRSKYSKRYANHPPLTQIMLMRHCAQNYVVLL